MIVLLITVGFAIRANRCQSLKQIVVDKDNNGQPWCHKDGKAIKGQETFSRQPVIGKDGKVFEGIVQRTHITGPVEGDLDLDTNHAQNSNQITNGQSIYRAIATNLDDLSDGEIIHFDNQRAEDSEHRIQALKNDFAAKQMPCGDFKANALCFDSCALSDHGFGFNAPTIGTGICPQKRKICTQSHRTIAAKVIQHGGQVIVQCQAQYYDGLVQAPSNIKAFKPLLVGFRTNNTKHHCKILIKGGLMTPEKLKHFTMLGHGSLF